MHNTFLVVLFGGRPWCVQHRLSKSGIPLTKSKSTTMKPVLGQAELCVCSDVGEYAAGLRSRSRKESEVLGGVGVGVRLLRILGVRVGIFLSDSDS